MSKKTLIWSVEDGFLTGRTPKTHKMVYSYDLYADLGSIKSIDARIDRHRSISTGFLHDDPIYDWFWYAMEDIGLASVAYRTAQLMNVLQIWRIRAWVAGTTDVSVEA